MLKENLFCLADLMPYSLPIAMYIFGSSNLFAVIKLWLSIVCFASFLFGLTALNAGHHHPDSYHDGDKLR